MIETPSNALRYYERGFREAWGPTSREWNNGASGGGSASFAASDFANGHVLMISAILAALLAYLTRGKGGRAAALEDIRRSPRLGPRVAQWMEENEARLNAHNGFRPRQVGGGGKPPEPAGTPKRKPAPREEEAPAPAPKRMPQKKVPCFKADKLPQGSVPEFDRQIAGQEAGLNDLTVDEYLKGRDAYKNRDPQVAREARAEYQETLKAQYEQDLRMEGLSRNEAKQKAAEMASDKMKTLAALHNPDLVAGGKDVIGDFGDRRVNSSIGAQWPSRVGEIDKAAGAVPAEHRSAVKMNAELKRCK